MTARDVKFSEAISWMVVFLPLLLPTEDVEDLDVVEIGVLGHQFTRSYRGAHRSRTSLSRRSAAR